MDWETVKESETRWGLFTTALLYFNCLAKQNKTDVWEDLKNLTLIWSFYLLFYAINFGGGRVTDFHFVKGRQAMSVHGTVRLQTIRFISCTNEISYDSYNELWSPNTKEKIRPWQQLIHFIAFHRKSENDWNGKPGRLLSSVLHIPSLNWMILNVLLHYLWLRHIDWIKIDK